MFDSACCNMFTSEIPAVNCEVLHKVQVLVSASGHDSIVKESECLEGGAHAKETESKTNTDGPVSADNENPHIGSDTLEGATNDDPLDVAIAASALGQSTPSGG